MFWNKEHITEFGSNMVLHNEAAKMEVSRVSERVKKFETMVLRDHVIPYYFPLFLLPSLIQWVLTSSSNLRNVHHLMVWKQNNGLKVPALFFFSLYVGRKKWESQRLYRRKNMTLE